MKAKLLRLCLLPALALCTGNGFASDTNLGRGIYQRHCAMCHGNNGAAMMAGAPDFNRGQGLMRSDRMLLERIRTGKNACPAYRGILNDQEILDVIAYIRTLF